MNIVFVIFRRPDLTRRVFERIAEAKPERLFVVADGPRSAQDEALCLQTRAVVENVNWPCDLQCDYADVNMGCRKRITSGLDRVFAQVEDAIVLEDDCLPHPTFFHFCLELLERYRQDDRIGHISGNNFGGTEAWPYSYTFSRYSLIWGWATWRRVWQTLDLDMASWPRVRELGRHFHMFSTRREAFHFEDLWNDVRAGKTDVWGLQWLYHHLVNGRLSVLPAVNLVTNLGFGQAGSRTVDPGDTAANVAAQPIGLPLKHPHDVFPHLEGEKPIASILLRERGTLRKRITRRLSSRHFYGALVRRTPGVGAAWSRFRDGRKPA